MRKFVCIYILLSLSSNLIFGQSQKTLIRSLESASFVSLNLKGVINMQVWANNFIRIKTDIAIPTLQK